MNVTFDTTALIKGILEPRRKKRDAIFEEQMRMHKTASSILENVYNGSDALFVPLVAVIEIATVASRLTGSRDIGKKNAEFVRSISTIVSENELYGEALDIAAGTKISGFDAIFIAYAKATNSRLVTDNRRMHEAAVKADVKSCLLRDMK